jgi:hypothetical protein
LVYHHSKNRRPKIANHKTPFLRQSSIHQQDEVNIPRHTSALHSYTEVSLDKNPFTPSLDEFVQEHSDVSQDEATDIKAKEFGSVPSTQF